MSDSAASPSAKVLTLALGQSQEVDLDNDGFADVSVKFADVYVNRAELTLKALANQSKTVSVSVSRDLESTEQSAAVQKNKFFFTRDLRPA